MIQRIKDGKLKALGVTSLHRLPLLPSVPTLDQQGIKGFESPSPSTPASFARLIADDLERWVPIVKSSGAKAD